MAKTSVTYVVSFEIRPGQEARFRAALDPVLDAMRDEESFVSSALGRDAANENRFLLHETWSDEDDVTNVQLKRPYRDAMNAALDEILARPREVTVWRPLRSDG